MEQEFLDWFEVNEKRFAHEKFDDRQIAYKAWLEGKQVINEDCVLHNEPIVGDLNITSKAKKMIVITDCMECPDIRKCTIWEKLTPKQKFIAKKGIGMGKFIFKDCPLEDVPNIIGFFKWLNDYEELKYTKAGIKFYINEYLFKKVNEGSL